MDTKNSIDALNIIADQTCRSLDFIFVDLLRSKASKDVETYSRGLWRLTVVLNDMIKLLQKEGRFSKARMLMSKTLNKIQRILKAKGGELRLFVPYTDVNMIRVLKETKLTTDDQYYYMIGCLLTSCLKGDGTINIDYVFKLQQELLSLQNRLAIQLGAPIEEYSVGYFVSDTQGKKGIWKECTKEEIKDFFEKDLLVVSQGEKFFNIAVKTRRWVEENTGVNEAVITTATPTTA